MKIIDADKFAEQLEEYFDLLTDDGGLGACSAIQDMLEDQPAISPHDCIRNEWISVEDRMPEIESAIKWGKCKGHKSVRVLCVCKQNSGKTMVKEGYCEKWDGNDKSYWKIPGSIDSVTHWMPMPLPPTETEH